MLKFQKNVTFRFPACASSLGFICNLAHRHRCSLIICHVDDSTPSRQVLEEVRVHLGARVEGLALPRSSAMESSFLKLLPCLTGLHKLDLSGLDSLFMSGAFLSREEHRQQVRGSASASELVRKWIENVYQDYRERERETGRQEKGDRVSE